MRVAVCLSGQPRGITTTWNSIRDYFENTADYTFDFFCHVWPYVTWKIPHAQDPHPPFYPLSTEFDLIRNAFNPITFEIGATPDPIPTTFPGTSQSMFRGMAMANQMRRKHEIANDFEYDWVIKGRYDLVFPAGARWQPRAMHRERQVCFSSMDRLPHEYRRINFSDVLFYGDSWGMDIAADAYFEMMYPSRISPQDFFSKRGPGTMLAEFLFKNNVLCSYAHTDERILRFESKDMDPIEDWDEIERIHLSYY